MEKAVRVRFAPSPTGPLHIGGVRTALFNYLFARKHRGQFIVRIEDTDQSRLVTGAESYIKETLEWCGITPDESPWHGSGKVHYKQSERKLSYAKYAQYLVDNNHAYYAFDTAEELNQMRKRLKAARVASPQYNAITRTTMKNSLTLSEKEIKKRLDSGEPYVIRLKVPRKEEVRLKDMVRGWVMVHSFTIDDKVLMKSDGMPTYHLANVVDDYLMGITHVIRGEEWLPSAPLHILLYQYLGWENQIPKFAHLPLLLKPDGNGKLSKRDGDKLGFSVFPLAWQAPNMKEAYSGYREDGYFPDAFTNFLAFLGWNPGNDREIFSINELIEAFSIDRVGKSGTKFDIGKARWFNQQYLKNKPIEELAKYLLKDLQKQNITCTAKRTQQICSLMKERVVFAKDLAKESKFFFVRPDRYDEKVARKKWKKQVVAVFEQYQSALNSLSSFNAKIAKSTLKQILDEQGIKIGQVMQALRVAVTGIDSGPDLMQIINILGTQEVADRIAIAVKKLAPYAE